MVSSEQRRRQLAREKFERQQKRRAQARKRKQHTTVIAAALAVVVAAGATAFATGAFSGDDDKKTKAKDPAAASESAAPTPPEEKKSPEPAMKIDKSAKYSMTLDTGPGRIAIAMDAAKTPRTVNSFQALADKGYFDNTKCHRLTTDGIFVLQCGDPKGDGTGGPGYNIPDENLDALGKPAADSTVTFPAGTVAMANTSQPNSGGSQFFLVYKDTKLPPKYTPFGKMDAAGLKTVQRIAEAGVAGGGADGPPKTEVTVKKATVAKG